MTIQIQYADLHVFVVLPTPLRFSCSTEIHYEGSQGNPLFRLRLYTGTARAQTRLVSNKLRAWELHMAV